MDVDPTRVGQTLTRDYNKAQKLFRQAMARQFVLGRQMVEIRDEVGETAFRQWMTRFCPLIPLPEAEALMHYSLTSGLAQKVDRVLSAGDAEDLSPAD